MVNSLLRYPPDCTKRPHRVTKIMKKIAQLSVLMMFTALAALADPLIDFNGGYRGKDSFYIGSFTVKNLSCFMAMLSLNAAGVDTKNAALLSYFGVTGPNHFTFAGFIIGAIFSGPVGSSGAFSATAFSTDLANTATP